MINVLLAWKKGAHSQNLNTNDEVELADAELEAIYGGCGQSGNESNGYGQSQGGYQPHGHHHHHHHHHGQNQPSGCSGSGNPYHHQYGQNGYDGYGNSSQDQSQPSYWQC